MAAVEDEGGYEQPQQDAEAEAGNAGLNFVEDDGGEDGNATELPYWKCEYCNVHTPSAVVKCVATGKWFCNNKQQGVPASCIVYHLVRSRHNEFEADSFSVKTYAEPEALVSALKRLSKDNLENLTPHWLHVFLTYSHPPVLRRIEAIRAHSAIARA